MPPPLRPEQPAENLAAAFSAPVAARECVRCTNPLPPDAIECQNCHALVHAAELEQIAVSASQLEQRREYLQARDLWIKTLSWVPSESKQAQWIRANIERLGNLARNTAAREPASATPSWARRFGPLAPLVLVLAKGKFLLSLFKLKFLLSLGSFIGVYWALYGIRFGIAFALLILLHEMGHYLEIKRRGLPADMPVFLPGIGAYVRWSALGVTTETRSYVSLAGPCAGAIGAAFCALVWWQTGDGFWVGLASLTAMLNVLNLIPVWVLDGGQTIAALDKNERIALAAGAVLLAALFGQPLFLLVAAGAAYRVFTKDLPSIPSYGVAVYYLLLLLGLGFLMQLAPRPA
jgi:Zn-dependent protease